MPFKRISNFEPQVWQLCDSLIFWVSRWRTKLIWALVVFQKLEAFEIVFYAESECLNP